MFFIEEARNSFFSVLVGTGLAFLIWFPHSLAAPSLSPSEEMDRSLSRSLQISKSIAEKSQASRLACDDILKAANTVRIWAHRRGAKHP